MNQREQCFPIGRTVPARYSPAAAPVRREPVLAGGNLVFPGAVAWCPGWRAHSGRFRLRRSARSWAVASVASGRSCSAEVMSSSRNRCKNDARPGRQRVKFAGVAPVFCVQIVNPSAPMCETARPGGPSLRRRVKSVSSASGPAGWPAPQKGPGIVIGRDGGLLEQHRYRAARQDAAHHGNLARQRLGIPEEHLEPYGHYKAKISLDVPGRACEARPDGKLVLVTAISPTPGGRGQDHHHGGARRCAEPHRQEGHHLPARAGARAGLRHEGRGGGRRLRAGRADGGHQPALHRRLLGHRAREQPARRADRQPHPSRQRARLRRAPHHLAARAGRERPRAARHHGRPRRPGQRLSAPGRLRHRRGLRGHGDLLPRHERAGSEGAPRKHRRRLHARAKAHPRAAT